MFSKKSNAPTAKPAITSKVPSILSAGMTVRGEVSGGTGDLQIEGTVIGRIEAEHVVVSLGGTVEGDIVAKAVGIHGVLNGAIRAGAVTLSATARVQGEILYEVLVMEAGAQLEANCRRISTVLAALEEPETKTDVTRADVTHIDEGRLPESRLPESRLNEPPKLVA